MLSFSFILCCKQHILHKGNDKFFIAQVFIGFVSRVEQEFAAFYFYLNREIFVAERSAPKTRKDYKARFATKFIIHFYKQNLLSKINLLLCYEIYSLIFYSLLCIFCSISIANLSIYFHIARVLKIFLKKIFLPLFYYWKYVF